ncbi:MAG: hypothetical protein K8W52_03200 [Deltaproteobacteria bacterium]|nr:hypothetical protein [Deltaproteobacteria bacterium]
MKLVAALALALCLVAAAALGVIQLIPPAPEPFAVGRSAVVRSVRFVGDREPAPVRDRLQTRIGAPLSDLALAADRATIVRALLDDSRLDATVDASVRAGAAGVDVAFAVRAGPAFQVGRVRLVGALATRFPDLAEQITIRTGDDVSERAIERSQERLAWWLAAHGVKGIDIRHSVKLDHAAARADITFEITIATALR